MTATATADTTLLRYGCGTAAGLPARCEHGPHKAATPGPGRRACQAPPAATAPAPSPGGSRDDRHTAPGHAQ